jgi:hypothetical protein
VALVSARRAKIIYYGMTRNIVRTNRGDEYGKALTMGKSSIAAQRCRRVMGAIGLPWNSYVTMY